jgi:hypothetical protein
MGVIAIAISENMAPQMEAIVTAFSTKISFDLIKSKFSSSM